MRNSIRLPAQRLERCDIGQRQLLPAFQTLPHALTQVCGFIFHSTEKFGCKSISAAETSQKDNISDPFYNSHIVQSPASVWIRIRYEPTDMFVFKHYTLFGLDDTIVPIRGIIPYLNRIKLYTYLIINFIKLQYLRIDTIKFPQFIL